MDSQQSTGGRFGSAGDAFMAFDDDLLGISRRKPVEPEEPTPAPTSAPSVRKKPASARPVKKEGSTRVYVGVPADVRRAAPQLAAQSGRTVADLLILGTQLDLPYGTTPKEDLPEGLPVGKRRPIEQQLTNLGVRITPDQHKWLTAKVEEVGAPSLRQYAGGALTAYVRKHGNLEG